jgi:small-conductance mechanosensitive channel
VYPLINSRSIVLRRRLTFAFSLLLTVLLLLIGFAPLQAQSEPPVETTQEAAVIDPGVSAAPVPEGNAIDGYPVFLGGEQLFVVRTGVPGLATAQERANVINQRLAQIARDPTILPEAIYLDEQDQMSVVMAGETVLFTILENDAVVYKASRQTLGKRTVEFLQTALKEYREERSLQRRIQAIGITLISTIALLIFGRGLLFISAKFLVKVNAAREAQTLTWRFNNTQILGSSAMAYLLSLFIRLLRLVLILVSLYIYVPFVLSQFSATEAIGDSLLQDIAERINLLAQGFVGYLPNLVMIGIIGLIAYYFIGFIEKIIAELGRADVYPWFYPEWVQPTTRLVAFLVIAIACVVAGPYLPGFGSPAFQGISLFLGALLTLGSSSAVSNAISGIILIYTRAFQLDDFIRIGDVTGNVNEKSLFVTRILTPKQEIVTIPNLSVLNSNVVNYSAICRESQGHLLLHTTVTLGYDAPWRQVHDVLVAAAKTTDKILSGPSPFVLQTSLNDFHVSYELNAYTQHPNLIPRIYSALHQNIQDCCNQAGIEILSPAFSSLRDGNHSTIPANYLPEDYRSPTFSVRYQDGT